MTATLSQLEKDSLLVAKLLQVSVEDNVKPPLMRLPSVASELLGQGGKPLLSVSKVDDILIERLSLEDCGNLRGQLLYLSSCLDRLSDEIDKSYISDEARKQAYALQTVVQRYVSTVIQCPELFGQESRSVTRAGEIFALMASGNEIPLLAAIRLCELVSSEAGADTAAEFAAPLILQVVQRIVSLRSFDVCSEQASGDVNTLALFLRLAKSNYVVRTVVSSPLFFPPTLPAPMKLPNQQTAPTNKNVFLLQTMTLIGRLLMPSTVDHILLPPNELQTKSAKHLNFHNLSRRSMPDFNASVSQVRAQLGSVMDSVSSVIQPLIRADEQSRTSVLRWFACAMTNSAARATMGWQHQVAPHGAQLAEHLTSPQAGAQLAGSLEKFRMLTSMQTARFGGQISTGTALNLAWQIFDLCKPISLHNCGGVDEFFLASTDPVAVELMSVLGKEARLGDSDRLRTIQQTHGQTSGPGAFKSQIFWLAVNAIHVLLLPACKEAETAIQCASVLHRDKKEGPMNDAYGEFHCFETVLNHPRFMELLAHVINLMLVMVLRCATGATATATSGPPSGPFESLDIRHDSEHMSDSMAILPSCMMEEIVELLDFYRLTRDVSGNRHSRDITDLLDPDLFLLFTIWTLGSDKIKNPNIRGKAAKVLLGLTKDPRFATRIERSAYSVRNITPACIRVFSAVEKTKQSYYDIRMHVKFELRIPIQQLFELLLNSEEHRHALRGFVSEFRDDFYKFASQLLNDTTYLLEEGLDTLMAVRKKEAAGVVPAESSEGRDDEGGTAGIGVDRGVEQEDQNEEGQDMYRRSRHDPTEHCRQYMRMGHQTMSTLHQMCKQACAILVDDKVVLDQMITSCLDPSLDRLVGPKCLELKSQTSKYDFALFEFDPKKLLYQILEMYVYLARGDRRERVAKALSEDQRYYRPETLRKAINIARREHLIPPEMLKEFEDFTKFTNEFATNLKSAMDSVEVPDEFLDPIMAEIMVDPVLLPTSNNIMDRRHIMRIILSDDHDPFNRQPLKPTDLVPQDELRVKIHAFCKSHNIPLDLGREATTP